MSRGQSDVSLRPCSRLSSPDEGTVTYKKYAGDLKISN
jgi:hypothetical protein